MAFGRWGRAPFKLGGTPPTAKGIYRSLRDGMGSAFSKDDSTLANRERRAYARGEARAQRSQQRGTMQSTPLTATDYLGRWVTWMQAPVDPSDMPHQRAAVCAGIFRGNGYPSSENIIAAVSTALGGESVSLITSRARAHTSAIESFTGAVPIEIAGGTLKPGAHTLFVGVERADGSISSNPADGRTVTIASGTGASLLVSPIESDLSNVVAVHYYLSVAAGSTSCSRVATNRAGAAIVISQYPSNPPRAGLHHHGIVVSPATVRDPIRRAKVHAVLGTMLCSWTTYSIIESSPFILGTSTTTGASPLTFGGV